MTKFFYEREKIQEHMVYSWYCQEPGGDKILSHTQVGLKIAVDRDLGGLQKHGGHEQMDKWYKKNQKVVQLLDVVLITIPDHVSIDSINMCINCTGYIKAMLNEYGINLNEIP